MTPRTATPVCPRCHRVYPCICSPAARAAGTAVGAIAAAVLLALTSCGLTDRPDPVGTVVELELDPSDGTYEITVVTGDGEEAEARDVPEGHVLACELGDHYPTCVAPRTVDIDEAVRAL